MSTATADRSGAAGVLRSFGSLLVAQVAGAVLGLVFWVLVARAIDPAVVGMAAAAISTQTLLGAVTSLGVGTMLISELPLVDRALQRSLLLRGLLVTTQVSVVVGLGFGLAAGVMGPSLRGALGTPTEVVVFAAGVAAAAAALVVDQAALGLRRAGLQVTRNLLASGLRFPLAAVLVAVGSEGSLALQIAWVLPLWVSIAVSLVRFRLLRRGPDRPAAARTRRLAHYVGTALRNHALSLALAAGSQLMPVLAALILDPSDNAALAIAWLLATFVFLPPYLLTTALFAHGANDSAAQFRATVATTLPAALTLSLALCVGSWVLGRPVLAIFGGHYADNSALLLALLAPAGLWMVVKDHLVAFYRSQRRYRVGINLTLVAVVMEFTGAAVGALTAGATGLCVGWLLATGVEILVYLPWLRRTFGGLRWHSPHHLVRDRLAARSS